MDGWRKFTVTQVLNLQVQRGSSRKPGKKIDRESLQRSSGQDGSTWAFDPVDSPPHQGAVESLIKAAKRVIHFSVSNQRLSVAEFLTVCSEVSNLLNERPIGVKPSKDSIINVLTPNSLLVGRATFIQPLGMATL